MTDFNAIETFIIDKYLITPKFPPKFPVKNRDTEIYTRKTSCSKKLFPRYLSKNINGIMHKENCEVH